MLLKRPYCLWNGSAGFAGVAVVADFFDLTFIDKCLRGLRASLKIAIFRDALKLVLGLL